MTADPRFARRVGRLAVVSLIALGIVWRLALTTANSNPLVGIGLAGGWLLMPSILGLSLRWTRIRYAVIVPSALVSGALVSFCFGSLPEDLVTRLGWLLITTGVLFGSTLGGWFWFRLLPVPASLCQPFSAGRTVLIAVHVSLIVVGAIFVVVRTFVAIAW